MWIGGTGISIANLAISGLQTQLNNLLKSYEEEEEPNSYSQHL